MKVKRLAILSLLLVAFITSVKADESSLAFSNDSPKVVASITPFYALVAAVMKGVGTPQLLVKPGASPHQYVLKVSEMALLKEADIIFWGGPALETFLVKPLQSLVRQHPIPMNIELVKTPGLLLFPLRQQSIWEGHKHSEGSDTHTNMDMHFWLDPQNAIILVERIVKILVMLDPTHADQYYENGKNVRKRLKQLDSEITIKLKDVKSIPYVVFHDAYQYFENRYGLQGVAAISLHPEVPVSARRLKRIRSIIKEKNVHCVFTEPQFSPKLVYSLVQDLPVNTEALDPEGQESQKNPDGYFQLLENLSNSLKHCLNSNLKQK